MDLRTAAGTRRFEPVEMGAVAVIVLASVLGSFFFFRLVPELESLYAGAGEPLSLRLRVYIGFCSWFLTLAPRAMDVLRAESPSTPPGCSRGTGHHRRAVFHG